MQRRRRIATTRRSSNEAGFVSRQGASHYGVVSGGGVVDLTPRLGSRYPDIKALLAAGALGEAERAAKGATADVTLAASPSIP